MELRVFIVEPEGLRRRLVCESVSQADGLSVSGAGASIVEATPAILAETDIVLVNASLTPAEHQALLAAVQTKPALYVVLVGSHPNLDALISGVDLPVRGFLAFNHLSSREFAESLRVIAYGGAVIEPVSAQLLLEYLRGIAPRPISAAQDESAGRLTDRERQVLALLRNGLSNKEIAVRMSISLGTVRAHLRNIFRKLDVTSRAGAAVTSLSLPPLTRRLAG